MQCRKKFASEPADTPPSAAYRTANDFTSVVRQRGFYYTTTRRSQVPRLRFRIADRGLRIVNRDFFSQGADDIRMIVSEKIVEFVVGLLATNSTNWHELNSSRPLRESRTPNPKSAIVNELASYAENKRRDGALHTPKPRSQWLHTPS